MFSEKPLSFCPGMLADINLEMSGMCSDLRYYNWQPKSNVLFSLLYPDKMWLTLLLSASTVADAVCPYVLERFFLQRLKKVVKITWYFNKLGRLAFAFRLAKFWDRKCPWKWIDSGSPIIWYSSCPKPTSLYFYFWVTKMLLTFHHCQPICQKLLQRYEFMYSLHAYKCVDWTWIYLCFCCWRL
jgi:hypothetical protein